MNVLDFVFWEDISHLKKNFYYSYKARVWNRFFILSTLCQDKKQLLSVFWLVMSKKETGNQVKPQKDQNT